MVVKQFGWGVGVQSLPLIGYVMVLLYWFRLRAMRLFGLFVDFNRLTRKHQIVWVLYGQASRAISMG
jgi:hypothetical protein